MSRAWILALVLGCAAPPPPPPVLLPSGVVGGTVSGREGLLPWVFVHVKTGLEGRRFDVPQEPVLLDQHGNEFIPHVLGLRAGQPLRVLSSDSGIHNVFCTPFHNPAFNETLMQDQSMTKVSEKSEVMIQFKCNIHGHMVAYAGVLDHPFFAVTGFDGAFEIRGLPPGDYTIEAWSEFHGTRQTRVTVTTGGLAPLRIVF
jgi:hypothetical protein